LRQIEDSELLLFVNGEVSSYWTAVLSGIPQGSILGPLLFIIFIGGLIEYCGMNTNIVLFADDAKLYEHIKGNDSILKLQGAIDECWNFRS